MLHLESEGISQHIPDLFPNLHIPTVTRREKEGQQLPHSHKAAGWTPVAAAHIHQRVERRCCSWGSVGALGAWLRVLGAG